MIERIGKILFLILLLYKTKLGLLIIFVHFASHMENSTY